MRNRSAFGEAIILWKFSAEVLRYKRTAVKKYCLIVFPNQSLIIHNFKRMKYDRHQTDSAGTLDEFPLQLSSRLVPEVQDSVLHISFFFSNGLYRSSTKIQ